MCWKVHKRGRKGADYMSRSSPLAEGPSGRATDTQVSVTDSKSIKLVQFDQQRSETDIISLGRAFPLKGSGNVCGQASARSTENTRLYNVEVLFAVSKLGNFLTTANRAYE